jgi:hypothetical protein
MKRFLSLAACGASLALAVLAAPLNGHARQGGNLGLGFIAGNPSGLSGKLWLGEANALDFIVGFDLVDDHISLNADYVWHEFGLIPVNRGQMPLYYGMGLWTSVARHAAFGARGVVGIEYIFQNAPLDAFLELAPGTSILPRTRFDVDAGIGMRFFF